MNGDIPLPSNQEDKLDENDSIELENELRDNTISDSIIYKERTLNNNKNVESLPYELTAQMSSISEEMLVFDSVDLNQENSIIAISNQEVVPKSEDKTHFFTAQFDNMEIRLIKAKNCYIKSKEYLEQGNLSLAIAEMEKCLENYSSLEDGASYLESLKQLEYDENKRISENLLNKGKEYFEKHNIDMALNLWNEAWQTFPLPELKTLIEKVNNILTTALEYYEKAQLLDNSNQLEEALEAVQECLKLNPDHRNAMLLQEVLKTKINMKSDLVLQKTQKRLQQDVVLKKLEENKNIKSITPEDNNEKQENNNELEQQEEKQEDLQDNIQEKQENNEKLEQQEESKQQEELQDNVQDEHEEHSQDEHDKIEELQEELEELQDNVQDEHEELVQDEHDKIEELQEELEELQDNVQEKHEELAKDEHDKIEELQEELEELQDNVQDEHKELVQDEHDKIEELQEELEELQDNIQDEHEELAKDEHDKIEELQEELEELQDNIQDEHEELAKDEHDKIEELQEELEELQNDIEKNEEADSEEKEKTSQDNLNDLIDSLDENCEDEVDNVAGTNEIDPLQDNEEAFEDLFSTQANTKVPKIFLKELEDDDISPKMNDLLSRTTSRFDRDMIISEQDRMKLLSQIPIEEQKQKERLTEAKRKNNHLLQQAQIAYKARKYDESLEIVEKLLSQSHEAEPELLAETQKLYTALMKHINSQKAIYILEEIEYSLSQFDIERIDFLFSNEVFKAELDRMTINRRDTIFKKTVEIANLRTTTRYYILIIFTILLSIIQLIQFIH